MVSAVKWFNSLKDKHLMKFVVFDIKDFYPSVIQNLLSITRSIFYYLSSIILSITPWNYNDYT